MCKAIVRAMIHKNVEELNAGDYKPALSTFSNDATLTFPVTTRGRVSSPSWRPVASPHPRIEDAPRSRRSCGAQSTPASR